MASKQPYTRCLRLHAVGVQREGFFPTTLTGRPRHPRVTRLCYARVSSRRQSFNPLGDMRTSLAFACLIASSFTGYAQLSPEPTPSTEDGVVVYRYEGSPNEPAWSTSLLAQYRVDTGVSIARPADGAADALGRVWTSAAPSRSALGTNGGTLRAIFLGDTSGHYSAGYCYSGSPLSGDSYVLGQAGSPGLAFGNWTDVSLFAGETGNFDFWVAADDRGYTAFHPENSTTTADVLWTREPLLVSTYVPALNARVPVDTWIVSVVDRTSSPEAFEFRFALQQFVPSGNTLPPSPVPEPSTYAVGGALACLGLAIVRRYKRR